MNKKNKIITALVIIVSAVSTSIILFFIFWYPPLPRVEFTIGGETIDDFAYWIDDIDKATVKDSNYDLIILDYSSDGSESGEFSSSEVEYMKSSGDKEKLLISYISIGEAEDYRYYWNTTWDADEDGVPDSNAPDWLDIENPDWEGNYKVHYWNSSWQDIIFEYLDKIISANFDGIYMDIIDAYEYYAETITHSDWLMIDFVVNISKYVKMNAGNNFAVFVQNADDLLTNSTYLNHIDGIGREDLFYEDNDPTDTDWRDQGIDNLNLALDDNKAVLVIDYPTIMGNIYDFYQRSINEGYLAYAADRELDSLKEYSFYPAT